MSMLVKSYRIHSSRRRQRWDDWEIAVLRDAPRTDEEKADFMGRTVHAIQCKRHELNYRSDKADISHLLPNIDGVGRCIKCDLRHTDECPHPKKALHDDGECGSWKDGR